MNGYATGTGTFICELLEHFRGSPAKLKHKYLEELHANEVAILPYYVANLNIEATFAAITGEYLEFKNLCFVDTLDNVGVHTAARGQTVSMFGSVSEENVARIKRQNSRKISVIIGNPPYNANQANENDNNKNREYPEVDARIKQTYIHESTAQKTKLYDMYARFFRWASDRLAQDGVLAFITNRSFIDSRTFDGFRKVVTREFSEAYIFDLGGDVRANPKLSGTKHNVFGIQTGVAISFFVKRHDAEAKKQNCRVFYARRPELESAEDKLAFISSSRTSDLEFEEARPDPQQNWINLTNNDFDELVPFIDRRPGSTAAKAIFDLSTNGVNTARDEWVYSFSAEALQQQMGFAIDEFNREQKRWSKVKRLDHSQLSQRLKWSESLLTKVQRSPAGRPRSSLVLAAHYRPYVTVNYYADPVFSDRLTSNHAAMFGTSLRLANACIAISAPGPASNFRTLASDRLCDWHFLGDTQMYSFVRYDEAGTRIDNITNWSLAEFRKQYQSGSGKKPQPLTKKAVFHYVYAVLHDPLYREKYAQNLKRESPRIPLYGKNPTTFWRWANWGAELMTLHMGYESVRPFALKRADTSDEKARAAGHAPKPALKADKDSGSIVIDSETTLTQIPVDAWRYQLGNRCALEWVLDQYKEKKSKDPTIREMFDTYRLADYKEHVIDLLSRVTTVSLETMRIVDQMQSAER